MLGKLYNFLPKHRGAAVLSMYMEASSIKRIGTCFKVNGHRLVL